MEITEDKIIEAAKEINSIPYPSNVESNTEKVIHNFTLGAKWMQEQLTPDWVLFESMTKDQQIQLNSIDSKRIMVLFDNGDICRFDEEHPFALMVASYVLPEPPIHSTT